MSIRVGPSYERPSKRLCYYLSNLVWNEVAMRESFLLPLDHIGVCVDVHTIESIAKNIDIRVRASLSVKIINIEVWTLLRYIDAVWSITKKCKYTGMDIDVT